MPGEFNINILETRKNLHFLSVNNEIFCVSTFYRCSCNDGYRCVLTGNMSSRSAYVFKCRENEISTNMYPFPQDVVNHFG